MTPIRIALVLVFAFAFSAGAQENVDRAYSPTVNYQAGRYSWGSPWGGALDAILGGSVFLDPSSTQPKGFLSRAYDGNPGDLADPTGSFLIFDGPRAAFRVTVLPWRTVDRFGFYALEAKSRSKASARLAFEDASGRSREIALDRRVVGTRGELAHVEYRSRAERLGASGGVFVLAYENADLASAFVSELVVDGMGQRPSSEPSNRRARAATCSATARFAPRVVFWEHGDTAGPGAAQWHSLIVQVADTGTRHVDLVPAWLVVPAAHRDPVPLVVLFDDPDSSYPALELLGLEGRPELAAAPALADAGVASLLVQVRRLPAECRGDLQAHLDRIRAVVAGVLDGDWLRHAKLAFGRDHVGAWGFGNGARVAIMAAGADARYTAIALTGAPADAAGQLDRLSPRRTLAIPTMYGVGAASRVARFFSLLPGTPERTRAGLK